MAKEKVTVGNGNTTFVKAKDLKEGDTISGTFIGTSIDQFEKTNYKIRAADGSLQIVNGSGQLNALMSQVSEGSNVDIVYQGKTTLQSGPYKGTKAHSFEVYSESAGPTANTASRKTAGASAGRAGNDKLPF